MATSSAFAGLLGETLLISSQQVDTVKALAGKESVALFFSAQWCPVSCREFTPKLVEWYKADLQAKGLEVVFISSDHDEGSFQEYFQQMPWLALPFEARDLKAALSQRYQVDSTPTLVILDASGNFVTADGLGMVSMDPTGESFPWKPQPGSKRDLSAQVAGIRRVTTQHLMDQQAKGGPCRAVCLAVCFFWVPMLFFMGAANVLPTCESDHYVEWMKTYGLLPMLIAIVVQVIAAFFACRGNGRQYKIAVRGMVVTSLITIALFIWGWLEYAKTSEELCVGEGAINPRKLALAYLILGSLAPCWTCMSMWRTWNSSASSSTMSSDPQAAV